MANLNNTMTTGSELQGNVELLPGTEIMTDVGNLHFARAHNSSDSTILLP
jgi:hypothetical protein